MLETNGIRGTFYTSPGLWGQQWHGESMATADHVDGLHHDGHEIGCQTFSGAPVDMMSCRDREHEVLQSAAAFRRNGVDRRFSSFGFPDGGITAAAKRQMARRFASCRGMSAGLNVGRADLALLRSVELADHALDLQAVDQLIDEAHRRSGWLVFRSRDVREAPSPHGCSPALLGHAIARAVDLGMLVLPIRSAVGRITGG
jgi:peptidoglycan/xylan/chitin deacetylase (PgdA/CDA1 family)